MAQLGQLPGFAQGHANDRSRRIRVTAARPSEVAITHQWGRSRPLLGRQHNVRERTCLPPGVGALACSPRNEVEDVPVLVLPELGFARMVLFSEFEDGPAAQQALDIAAAVKIHPALRYVPAVVGAE